MAIETFYRITKHDNDGHIVSDSGMVLSHSYVIQLLEFFDAIWNKTDKNATDVDGAETVMADVSDLLSTKGRVDAGATDDAYGIVVGTNAGVTAEDNENYALDTKILNGSGGGQLSYGAVTFLAPAVDGANVDYDITRTFANASGGEITVKEIGIIIKNTTDTKYHLILRDVVADEAVADGYTLTVIYTQRTTV